MAKITHQIFSLARDWSKRIMRLNIPLLKLENIRVIFPNFMCCEKYLKDNKSNSRHLARKYARILFYFWTLSFHRTQSFLQVMRSETVSFSERIMSSDKYASIFPRQMEAISLYSCTWVID